MKKTTPIILLILICMAFLPLSMQASTASDLRQQINDTNSQIDALQEQIDALNGQLDVTGQQKNTLNNAIKELTITRNKLLKEKDQTEKKINNTSLIIEQLGNNIDSKEESIRKSEESLRGMLYSLYQSEEYTLMERMLANEKLSEFSRDYNNVIAVNSEVKDNIGILQGQKKELTDSQITKMTEQDKLNELKKTLVAKETAVLSTKKEKDALLTETKNKEAEYQKMLADQLKKKETFEKAISDYESQLKFILNPNSIPKEGSGALSWPLSHILITSPYGSRWGSFHYGDDFRASIGTSVFAMGSGIVEGTGNTDIDCKGASFGKWIFIKYNNGLSSTFGHLSSILVQQGQTVNAGDLVALSGNTGYSEAPHLHVSVYASSGVSVATVPSKSCNGKIFTQPIAALSAYLNPLLYLPKTDKSMFK